MSEGEIRLRLYLRLVARKDRARLAADVKRVTKMAEAVLSAPVLGAISKAKVGDRAAKTVTTKTRAAVAAVGKEALIEYFDQPRPGRAVWAQLTVENGEIEVRSVVEGTALAMHRATALDDLTAACVRAALVWRGVAVVRQGWIKVEHVGTSPPYPRLRKPRESVRFPARSLVTFLDPGDPQRAEDVAALAEPAPAHAAVTTHGALIEVRWVKGLSESEITRASTWHDCWIRRTVTEPDEQFNAQGDQLVDGSDAEPRAPLTLYDAFHKRGFKAVLVTPRGKLEKSALAEARKVLRSAGDEVTAIWIVVPLRAQARALHAQVVADGFEGALYPGEAGQFWDPKPKGPWLKRSTDTGATGR